MAYFSNGSEGEQYQVAYCNKCIHDGKCPILDLHFWWNCDQNSDAVKREALNSFIPISEDGLSNGECRMFIEAKR